MQLVGQLAAGLMCTRHCVSHKAGWFLFWFQENLLIKSLQRKNIVNFSNASSALRKRTYKGGLDPSLPGLPLAWMAGSPSWPRAAGQGTDRSKSPGMWEEGP